MEFDSVIKKRHSVKNFQKLKKASWKKAVEAIDSALQGPFAGNINSLKFIIVEDKKKMKELAKHSHQSFISQSSLVIVVCSDETRLENHYGERGRIYNKQHAGAAINTIILKLADLNIGSCWIGAYTDEFIRNSLNIPAHIQVEALIPIGYEKSTPHKSKSRKASLEKTLYWNKWENDKRSTIFKDDNEEELERE